MQRDLVEAARRGDHAAFEVLAAAEIGRLYAFGRMVLGDAHQAEDAVQDTLIRAWRACRNCVIPISGTPGSTG